MMNLFWFRSLKGRHFQITRLERRWLLVIFGWASLWYGVWHLSFQNLPCTTRTGHPLGSLPELSDLLDFQVAGLNFLAICSAPVEEDQIWGLTGPSLHTKIQQTWKVGDQKHHCLSGRRDFGEQSDSGGTLFCVSAQLRRCEKYCHCRWGEPAFGYSILSSWQRRLQEGVVVCDYPCVQGFSRIGAFLVPINFSVGKDSFLLPRFFPAQDVKQSYFTRCGLAMLG